MAVRSFYVTADIEGRNTSLTGGTRSKTGEMEIKIQQRNKGLIETAFKIESYTFECDNKLYLRTIVRDTNSNEVARYETEY